MGNRSKLQKHLANHQVVQELFHMLIAHTKIKTMGHLHATFGVNCKNSQLETFVKVLQFVHMKAILLQTMMFYVSFGMKILGSRTKLMVLDQMQRLPLCIQLVPVEVRADKQLCAPSLIHMYQRSVPSGVKTKNLVMETSVLLQQLQHLHVRISEWLMNKYCVMYGNRSMLLKHLANHQVVQELFHMLIAHTKIKTMGHLHATFGVNCKNSQLETFVKVLQFVHMKAILLQTMMFYVSFGMKILGSRTKLMVLDQMQRLPLCIQLVPVEVKADKQLCAPSLIHMYQRSVPSGVKTKNLVMETSVLLQQLQPLHVLISEWLMNKYCVMYGNRSMLQKHLANHQVVQELFHILIAHTKIKTMGHLHATFGVNCKNSQLETFVKVLQFVHTKAILLQTMIFYVSFGMKILGSRTKLIVLDQIQRL